MRVADERQIDDGDLRRDFDMRKTSLSIELAACTAGDPPVSLPPVLAWARDAATGRPRYILELEAHERGARCGCVCPACGLDLTAVNAAVDVWRRRPHFRHPTGAERDDCNLLAARYAVLEALHRAGELVLPMRRRSATATGLSGAPYTAWVNHEPQRVHIRNALILDLASAVLVLDDGRRLLVELSGGIDRSHADHGDLAARITLSVDDPIISSMSPAELLDRLQLLADGGSWQCHWADAALDRQALAKARDDAVECLDLDIDDGTIADADEAARAQRRESILHAEVKRILAQAQHILVPPLQVSVSRATRAGAHHWRSWEHQQEVLKISAVELEQRLGETVPDVVATLAPQAHEGLPLADPTAGHFIHGQLLLVEVTVTNAVTEERLDRIARVGLATLEVDLSQTGGRITREALRNLVVEAVVCKRWIYHPELARRTRALTEEIDSVIDQLDRQAKIEAAASHAVRALSTERIGEALLSAVMAHCMFRAQIDRDGRSPEKRARLLDLIDESHAMAKALAHRGYPEALDTDFFMHHGCILSRLLSIRLDTGVGYRFDKAWPVLNAINGEGAEHFGFHALYLFAARLFKPELSDRQVELLEAWRKKVRTSRELQGAASPYRRNTRYDRLLCLLFPEMAPHLSRQTQPSGSLGAAKSSSVPATASAHGSALQPLRGRDGRYYLRGQQLEAWLSTKTPEEASEWREFLAARG